MYLHLRALQAKGVFMEISARTYPVGNQLDPTPIPEKREKPKISWTPSDTNDLRGSLDGGDLVKSYSRRESISTETAFLPNSMGSALKERKARKAKDIESPLYFAARRGNYQKLEHCLKSGDNPNVKFPELRYENSLIAAVQHHHTKCVELLLDHGANANIKDKTGRYLLALALVWGQEQPEVCRLLMAHGARPDVEYWPNKTIAQLAFSQKNIDQVDARGKEAYAIIRGTCYAKNLIPLSCADHEFADYSNLQD